MKISNKVAGNKQERVRPQTPAKMLPPTVRIHLFIPGLVFPDIPLHFVRLGNRQVVAGRIGLVSMMIP